MTFKLPEPEITLAWCDGVAQWEMRELKHCLGRWEDDRIIGYTEVQFKQGLRDVLEQVAEFCELNQVNHSPRGNKSFSEFNRECGGTHEGMSYAAAIRKMIGEI